MREALIVWGGWSGHEPEQGAHIVAKMLKEHGFKVYIENTTEAFADPAIADMSLIVPIVTMSKIEKEEVENLTAAVRFSTSSFSIFDIVTIGTMRLMSAIAGSANASVVFSI